LKPSIVLKSRVRLHRNLSNYPFSNSLDKKESLVIFKHINNALNDLGLDLKIFKWDKLTALKKRVFLEKGLITEAFYANNYEGSALACTKDISFLINEDDHLVIQVIRPGKDLDSVWKMTSTLDDKLGKKLEFAFDTEIGFLTACPTKAGTGLKVASVLHLPALTMSKQMPEIIRALVEKRIFTRPVFGVGTLACGHYFFFETNVSTGSSEQQIINNIKNEINYLEAKEIQNREKMISKDKLWLTDKVERAIAVLRYAKLLSYDEAIDYLSILRMGIDLGLYGQRKTLKKIDNLSTTIRSGHLQTRARKALNESQEEVNRAELVRMKLKL